MRWPIRNQILMPFALLQGLAIGIISISAAWNAASHVEHESISRLNQIVATLSGSTFPVRSAVLDQMKGLSGADFIAADSTGTITATTLPQPVARQVIAVPQAPSSDAGQLGEFRPLVVDGEKWLVGGVQVQRSRELRQLLVLIPERQWQAVRRDVILPPLLIGACTMLMMAILSYLIAARLGARLDRMQHQVGKLATLQFDNLLPVSGDDELTSLASSINRMAQGLQEATHQIRLTERNTLIAQVAGGLAHQLRNSITGARMAIQLHMRRTPDTDPESLQVAIRQLNLTENQIRGLLSLTRDVQRASVAGRIDEILTTIRDLLQPQFQHADTLLTIDLPAEHLRDQIVVADAELVQAALLNLIQNALEACRPGGHVQVTVSITDTHVQVDVSDNGLGIAEAVQGRIFEPFVTGKPDGVGLGLTLAAQVADSGKGSLTCERTDNRTRFRFLIERIAADV